jgi:acetyl esterase/lipase
MKALLLWAALAGAAFGQKAELDIVYAGTQTLDLYTPARKGFATVVYTYGGGWHAGSGKSSKPIAEMLQSMGYGCALVSHRLSPPHVFPAHAEDVAAAARWVRSNIAARGGDAKKLVLMGHSSGAHLSLLLATDRRYLGDALEDVRAVVGLSTPVDLAPRGGGSYGDVLMAGAGADAFRRDAALMRDASPIVHVTAGVPPTLLVVGEHDFPMLAGDARAFAAKAGDRVQVFVAPGKDHMGVARGMTDATDPVLKRVKEFLLLLGI